MENKVISIEYELKDTLNGELIDSNLGGKPFEFVVGKGNIIPGLEKEVIKMGVGDSGVVLVKAEDAYGSYNEQAIETLPIEQFSGLKLYKGMNLYGRSEDGSTVEVRVKDISENSVVIDYNHALAGKDLSFLVKVLDIRDATREELECGNVCYEESGCCGSGCGCH